MKARGPTTELIHRGEEGPWRVDPLTVPIYETTTFLFETADEVRRYQEGTLKKYLYSRYENPTVVSTEQKLSGLDRTEAALVFASGMAATATVVLTFLGAGDELVASAALYGGTFRFFRDVLPRFGIRVRFVTLDDLSEPDGAVAGAKVVWFESPINPTLRCVDVARVARACRAGGAVSVVDNTFASPVNQRPIDLGVDLTMQSATKYLNGHSDVTGGVVAGPSRLVDPVSRMRRQLGGVMDPQAAYALGRGLKTLALRVERHNTSAMMVARWLEQDRRVARVFYPGLASHPDHAVAASQMHGYGGMVTFDLGGDYERAAAVYDRLGLIKRATSLGGVESLASLPVLTSHHGYSAEDLRRAGVTPGMVRLSVGLEDPDDLIADLDQALG